MPVPASVSQLLEKQNVNYSVAMRRDESEVYSVSDLPHEQHLRQVGAARSLILQDGEGRVQVVVSADGLFDIQTANQLLGRTLRPASAEELKGFLEKHKLTSIPALPKLGGMPTLVDRRLLDRQTVLLDSGANELLAIDQNDFAQMVSGAHIGDITVSLEALEKRLQDVSNDEADLLTAVKSFTAKRIKQRLEETLELPPLPETAQRIIKLRVDPNADVGDLANIVEVDPSLAAQVVSWASSPYYSAPGKIRSIHDAIVRVLGFDMVLNLALGLALGKTMSMPKDSVHGATSYWEQAVYTAATVESLVRVIPREHRPGFGMAYLSGLLHNFGWLALAEVFPPQFGHICRCLEVNNHIPTSFVEQHILGVTREQIASWLMQLWGMPEEVVIALRHQHNSANTVEHGEYAKLIFLAQRLLQQKGIGQGPCLEIPQELFSQLHLDSERAQQAVEAIFDSSADLDNIAQQLQG